MDFFGHQDQARKRTKLLIILYMLAIACLVGLTNVLLASMMWNFPDFFNVDPQVVADNSSLLDIFNYMTPKAWLVTSFITLSFLGCAYLFKAFALRNGGSSIAHSLGARLILPDSEDFHERRLLNIVEEMAIASGMPVPQVYVMDHEIGINAFAAGYQPSDAIIGVTQGCLTKLSRKQLQGVIGHEFSHIVNGDMRLNMRLIALLFGILCIALLGRVTLHASLGQGRHRMQSSSKNNENRAPMAFIGLGFLVIGYLGVFFGKIIQAAVSRQREFLADASAVQFTRDPEAVGEALKVIGYGGIGSAIGHSKRDEYSHAFFGDAIYKNFNSMFSIFSTHPKLEERINRIDARWDGEWVEPQTLKQAYEESPELAPKPRAEELITGVAAAVAATIDFLPSSQVAQKTAAHEFTTADGIEAAAQEKQNKKQLAEDQLNKAAHDPFSARAVCYTLLLAPQTSLVHDQQLDMIKQFCGDQLLNEVQKLLPAVQSLDDSLRLPSIEKAIPALKQISPDQYTEFKQVLIKLAKADGKIDLFEWCLYRLILQYLNPAFDKAKPVKALHGNPKKLKPEIETVLSFVANHGHDTLEETQNSFAIGAELAGFNELKLQPRTDSLKQFNLALDKLTQAYPHVKGRVLKALAGCVKADGVRIIERELVQTIAAILESPTPDLFD